MKTMFKAGLGVVLALGVSQYANAVAVTYYDANGFETFANGNLEGQTAGTPALTPAEAWAPNPGGSPNTAIVQATNGVGGTKGVHLDHPANSGAYRVTPLTDYVSFPGTYATHPTDAPNPVSGNRYLHIDWDMKVNASNAGANEYGPLFGVEAYIARPLAGPVIRIGGTYVDATDGSTNYPTATAFGPSVSLGSYQSYSMIFDWATETYDISINGSVPAAYDNLAWEAPQGISGGYSVANFADADLMVSPFAGDVGVAASADFDKYNVYWTPEPASLGVIGGLGIILARRRK